MPSKITSAGDSKFRVINKPYNGGDCWINISKDLKPLFNYNKGDKFDIRIHKEDFIKALNIISILSFGDLWECPSKELKRFIFTDDWLKEYHLQILGKFGSADTAIYKAKYGAYSQDRSYIQNDDDKLNIRDYLIEKHSRITVERQADGLLDMRIETSIHDLSSFSVKNQLVEEDYDVEELAKILKSQYENAPDKEKVLSIHMFGLRYGEHILSGNGVTISQIIRLSGLPDSYTVEVNKGVNIYRAIKENKYGVMFGDDAPKSAQSIHQTLQQIFYGAPGTGKSHRIEEDTEGQSVIRTTFHPDTDYSTFVGAYKPIMESTEMKVIPVVVNNGISLNQNEGTYTEKRITYRFVKQAFLKAYLGAWKKMTVNPSAPEPQYLIIEEINRGNCAQIFGDLFQLLDRGDKGYSAYTIEADTDMQQAIADAFKDEDEYKLNGANINAEEADIKYTSNYGKTLSEDIQEGRVLLLPKNLYIWATMNTSDQSLFPIDSAFKRRWEWVYMPIKDHKDKNYKIEIDGTTYDWWGFLDKINSVINTVTSSEDKKIGYFFVKTDKIIEAKQFVGKVLFYLWNDVFKNYGFDNPIFNKEDKNKFAFSEFFQKDGSPEIGNINKFLKNLDETIDKDHSFTETKAASETSATDNSSQDLFANQ